MGVLESSEHLCESVIKMFMPRLNDTRIVGLLSFQHLWRIHEGPAQSE